MNLREVCALEPGELIKGVLFDIRKKKEYLSKEGWLLLIDKNHPPVPLSASSFNEHDDETVRIINVYYIPNQDIQGLLDNVVVIKSKMHSVAQPPLEKQIDTTNLSVNSKVLKGIISDSMLKETFSQGSCIGMSLGETIVLIIPSDFSNRSNYAAICCLHKMLFGNRIVWLVLCTQISTNYYEKFFSNLPDAKMEI